MDSRILLYNLAGNTIFRYILFISVFTGCIILLKLFRIIVFARIKKLSLTTDSKIDDMILASFQKNIIPAMYLASIYLSTGLLKISSCFEKWSRYIFLITLGFLITRFVITLIIFFLNRFWLVKTKEDEISSISVLINTIIKILVWSVAILILLDNLGVKVSGLIAGLGISGVAIAFAAQSILRDIFNYFTIFFDRPFEIGDFLVIDQFAGVVEHIGVKTTRIRSLGGELLIFANTDLTGSRVRNYKSMQERRVVFSFGITYGTPPRKIKKIPDEISKIIGSMQGVRFDRAHFQKFGDSSLDFEIVYYVLSGEYNTYMDIQQEINLSIMSLFEKMKVEFAYPTRTVFLRNEN